MDENQLETALITLQNSTDDSITLKQLITIRKEVDWPSKRENITCIREKNYMKNLIIVLQSNQKNFIDITLSILGNCCMDSAFTTDLIEKCNIPPILYHLLKRYSKDNSINGRIFRILSNICQHRGNWSCNIINRKPQIITYIVDFLKTIAKSEKEIDNISEGTIVMAIRALREFLNSFTSKLLIKDFKVLETIGMLLIKYSLEWLETKRYEGILHAIIRLLQGYSNYKYYRSILEMKQTEKGDAIMYLSKILLLAPKEIVKIVMNFIEICQLKSDLPIPEIFDSLIQVLSEKINAQEFNDQYKISVQSLCYLLKHPTNRHSERCSKTISLLIEVLSKLTGTNKNIVSIQQKETVQTVLAFTIQCIRFHHELKRRDIDCCTGIVVTLANCRYNNSLLLEQLNCNIIDIIIDKLNLLVGCTETLNTEHNSIRKRKSKTDKEFMNNKSEIDFILIKKEVSCSETETLNKINNSLSNNKGQNLMNRSKCMSSASPSSPKRLGLELDINYDPGFFSSVSSPSSPSSSSMTSCPSRFSDSDSDDDYSPVCSEADPNEFNSSTNNNNNDNNNDDNVDELLLNSNDLQQNKNINNSFKECCSYEISFLYQLIGLLKLYLNFKPTTLIKPQILIALTKCCCLVDGFDHFRCHSIGLLCDILSTHSYLVPILQTNYIPMIYNLNKIQHGVSSCTKCYDMQDTATVLLRVITLLAESSAGKGEIAHCLFRADDLVKQQLVISIPYVIRNKSILSKLMLNCGGLNILMRQLRIESEMKRKCIKVICLMATKKLLIKNPNKRFLETFPSRMFQDDLRTIHFEETNLDKINIVTFKLDDGSEVNANRLLLSEKSEFFNKLLTGNFKESNEKEIKLQNVINKSLKWLLYFLKCNINKTDNNNHLEIETLLDIIGLCDRFLLVNLSIILTNYVEQHRITNDTVPIIYQWSLESQTNLLRIETVAYALVGDMIDIERYEMFEKLFNLGYLDELIDDIQSLLVRYLSMRTN